MTNINDFIEQYKNELIKYKIEKNILDNKFDKNLTLDNKRYICNFILPIKDDKHIGSLEKFKYLDILYEYICCYIDGEIDYYGDHIYFIHYLDELCSHKDYINNLKYDDLKKEYEDIQHVLYYIFIEGVEFWIKDRITLLKEIVNNKELVYNDILNYGYSGFINRK